MHDTDADAARRLLAAAVSDVPSGIDLLTSVHKVRAARRTRTRAALAATATFVIASGTTVGLTLSQAPSALAAVTAAASRTAAQSYRATVVASTSGPLRSMGTYTYSGIFDPTRGIGEETLPATTMPPPRPAEVIRLIGHYVYIPAAWLPYGKRWLKVPDAQSLIVNIGSSAAVAVNQYGPAGALYPLQVWGQVPRPDDLLTALKSAGRVREIGPVSGPGWNGTRYAFTAVLSPSLPSRDLTLRLSGTVDVDQAGRVRATVVTVPFFSYPKSGPAKVIGRSTATVAFSNYGLAVSVTAPPASETYTVTLHPSR